MLTKNLVIVFLSFVCLQLQAQNFSSADPNYIKYVQLGEKALLAEKFDSCLVYYAQAFEIKQTSVLSTMRAATCAYGAKNELVLDQMLDTAYNINYSQAKGIFEGYPEFEPYLDTELHERIQNDWKTRAIADGLDLELIEKMKEVRVSDQAQRQEMRGISEKYGWQSPQMDSLWKLQSYSDSVNTIFISNLIDERGYPGRSMVGADLASTAFLVIQHADIDVQQKYLPIIKDAADAGEVRWSSVALLIDRVNLRTGKPQIYGSQVSRDEETGEHYFSEIENPEKVDSIRATVGLGPLQSYADNWDFTWDPIKHKERIAKMKAEEKKE